MWQFAHRIWAQLCIPIVRLMALQICRQAHRTYVQHLTGGTSELWLYRRFHRRNDYRVNRSVGILD